MLRQDIKPYVIARQPGLQVAGVNGFELDTSRLTSAEIIRFQNTMTQMRPGDVSMLPIKGGFVVFRVQKLQARKLMPFLAVKEEALRLATLQKAPEPGEYLARLYRDSHPVFEANQYADYFAEYENAKLSAVQTPTVVQTASAR